MKNTLIVPIRRCAIGFVIGILLTILVPVSMAQAQTVVQGRVSDAGKNAIVGVNVVAKGTGTPERSVGTTTDADGGYKLTLPDGTTELVFSFLGYVAQTVSVNGNNGQPRPTIDVTLAENNANLDEVVVTGVFDPRSRMSASVAISTLNARQLERIVPTSGIDLLKNIPGVYVNSSRGEVSGSLYTRGLSVGGGFYYVSMQEDGLPIMAIPGNSATDPLFKPDGFLRADASIARVEVVRGGTASILGANAPGGIFNYVSKTGGNTFAGEVRARVGLEGDGKNPYYRTDVNFGGPLTNDKSLTYNVGGFYRYANGAKYPGYPLSYGGQIKANLVKTYKSGSLKLYGKFLNDHTAQFEFTPTVSFTDPKPVGSFTNSSSTLIGPVAFTIPGAIWNRSESLSFDSQNVGHYKDYGVGLNWEQRLGEGFTLTNNIRLSTKSTVTNTTAVVFPFRVDQATFYGVSGNLGPFGTRFGLYDFYNPTTGNSYGTVNFLSPANVKANNLTLPGGDVQPNSLLYNPTPYNDVQYDELVDQFTLTKRFNNMSFTAGGYLANSHVTRLNSGPAGQGFSTIEEQPQLVGIRYTNAAGATFDFTDKNGIANYGAAGPYTNDARVNQYALFFGHNWDITPKLNFDWGFRYENFTINSSFSVPVRQPDSQTGGADGNASTLYDNRVWKDGASQSFEKSLNTLSYSAGLNYTVNTNFAVYARYSQGRKSPDLGFFMDIANQQLTANISAEAQDIRMLEAGIKYRGPKLNLFLTPFYNIISNIPNFQIFQYVDATYYGPPRAYQKIRTQGVEIEANYALSKRFSIRAAGVVQGAKALEYSVYLANANGPADDKLVTYNGNQLDNVAPIMATITPTYSHNKLYASLTIQYTGKRWANVGNAFELPGFWATDLNLGYDLTQKLRIGATVNNLTNTYGVMAWAAPGGFPASLDTQGFTKGMLEANPNTVYSTLSILPRSYFLTASYRF